MTRASQKWIEDRSVQVGLVVGIIIWLMSVALIGFNWMNLPPEIPWFYSLPWGEDQLIMKNWLLAVVVSFGGLLLLNTALARILANNEELLRRILVWGGVVMELLLFLSLVRVIRVIL